MKKSFALFIVSALSIGALFAITQYTNSSEMEYSLRNSKSSVMSSIGVPEKIYAIYNYVDNGDIFNPTLQAGVSDWVLKSSNTMIIGYLDPQAVADGKPIPQRILDTMALVQDRKDYYVILSVGGWLNGNQFLYLNTYNCAKNLAKIAKDYNVGIEISYLEINNIDRIGEILNYYRLFNAYGESRMSQILTMALSQSYMSSPLMEDLAVRKIGKAINLASIMPSGIDLLDDRVFYWNQHPGFGHDSQLRERILVGNYIKYSCSNFTDVEIALNYKSAGQFSPRGITFYLGISPKNCELYPTDPYCGIEFNKLVTIGDGPIDNPSCPAITEGFKKYMN